MVRFAVDKLGVGEEEPAGAVVAGLRNWGGLKAELFFEECVVQSERWQGLYVYDTVDSDQVQVGLLRDQDIPLRHLLAMQRVYIKRTASPAQLVVDCVEARKVQLSAHVCRLVFIGFEDWGTGNDGGLLFVSGLGQRD